jgi:hypothetical protein
MDRGAAGFYAEILGPGGLIGTDRLTASLHITKSELAQVVGLSRDAVSKTSRLHARATQARLRDFVDILNRVLPWAGSVHQAFAWYRAQPIPSFGDLTAEDLVREGRTDELKAYLSRIAAGGYA